MPIITHIHPELLLCNTTHDVTSSSGIPMGAPWAMCAGNLQAPAWHGLCTHGWQGIQAHDCHSKFWAGVPTKNIWWVVVRLVKVIGSTNNNKSYYSVSHTFPATLTHQTSNLFTPSNTWVTTHFSVFFNWYYCRLQITLAFQYMLFFWLASLLNCFSTRNAHI